MFEIDCAGRIWVNMHGYRKSDLEIDSLRLKLINSFQQPLERNIQNVEEYIPMEPSKHFIAAPTAVSSWMMFNPFSRVWKHNENKATQQYIQRTFCSTVFNDK